MENDENSFRLSPKKYTERDRVFETNEPVLRVMNGTTLCRNARHTNPGYDRNDTYTGGLSRMDGREINGKCVIMDYALQACFGSKIRV